MSMAGQFVALEPTGELRWLRPRVIRGDVFTQVKLQQKWSGIRIYSMGTRHEACEEWVTVPVAFEEDQKQ